MKVYLGGHGKTGFNHIIEEHPRLGLMFTPFDMKPTWKGRYALDNGAFSNFINGSCFDAESFLWALKRVVNPDFVVIPDIVAGGLRSLKCSTVWREFLPDTFKWYLAVQDGMTPNKITDYLLSKSEGIFVGGSMEWKQKTGEDWVKFAHNHNKKAHIGRIGTLRGLLWSERINADSVDSTNFVQHKKNWEELLEWLQHGQQRLCLTESYSN